MASEPSRNIASPLTFSLRTMFFIVTCGAVASAGYAFGQKHDMPEVITALIALGLFFTAWFATKGRVRPAIKSFSATIFLLIFVPVMSRHTCVYSRRDVCFNNLRQIGLAVLMYEDQHHRLPPAYLADANGKPMASWRTLLLRELDRSDLHAAFHFDEVWDSPANSAVSNTPLPIYECPSDPATFPAPLTSYVAVVGPNTAWPGAKGRKMSEIKNPSKTILVIEVANSGINWAEPRDLTIAQVAQGLNPKNGLGPSSHHPGGVNVLFADGHVEFLPEDIDPKELARMCDINPPDDPAAASRGEK